MKKCSKCGETKPLSEFYKASGGKDGVRGDCKVCHLKHQHALDAARVAAEASRHKEKGTLWGA